QNQDQDLAITPELRDSELDMRDNIPTDLVRANEPAPNGVGRRIQPLENGTVTRQRIDGRGEAPRIATSREQVPPFDPLGLPIGSFYLFPSLEVSETFTDNVFISATRKASDATTIIIPSLRLESNWNNHALEFSLGGSSTHHAKHKSQDSKGFNAGLRGRIDVTTRTNILGGASYSVTQETGSSIDFNTASVSPSDITTTSYFTELNHRFNRLSVRLRGTRDTSDFANAASVGGAVINNTDRNRTTDTVQTQLNYEFSHLMVHELI
ncbi:MAG: outer membrane beta-barrel protein, partial [Campylobacteraceae bacterium]|nr:outer membrane beta-barrel protein [Campylobacteraceae bacterium]